MRLHFTAIPALDPGAATDDLNAFLASHRVLSVERTLVQDGARSAWAVCVTYTDSGGVVTTAAVSRKNGIDYREVLPEDQFVVYARLRTLRKELSERDAVPPYALFTNEQLAEMVQRPIRETLAAAREWLLRERLLEVKPGARVGRSEHGASFLGFRVLPGTLRLSVRRRRRYRAARSRWEAAFLDGRVDALGLQAGYASALAITAHADAAAWRRAELARRPPLDA